MASKVDSSSERNRQVRRTIGLLHPKSRCPSPHRPVTIYPERRRGAPGRGNPELSGLGAIRKWRRSSTMRSGSLRLCNRFSELKAVGTGSARFSNSPITRVQELACGGVPQAASLGGTANGFSQRPSHIGGNGVRANCTGGVAHLANCIGPVPGGSGARQSLAYRHGDRSCLRMPGDEYGAAADLQPFRLSIS